MTNPMTNHALAPNVQSATIATPALEVARPRCVGGCTPNNPSGCGSLRNQDTPKVESPRERIEPHAVEWGARTVGGHTVGLGFLSDQRFIKGVWCRSGGVPR